MHIVFIKYWTTSIVMLPLNSCNQNKYATRAWKKPSLGPFNTQSSIQIYILWSHMHSIHHQYESNSDPFFVCFFVFTNSRVVAATFNATTTIRTICYVRITANSENCFASFCLHFDARGPRKKSASYNSHFQSYKTLSDHNGETEIHN